MALNTAGINLAHTPGLKSGLAYVSLHAAQPDATGSNATTAGRQAAVWTGPSAGVITLASTSFTGGGANGACQFVGYWSTVTGGTFYGWHQLVGDQTFNASGQYTVTGITDPPPPPPTASRARGCPSPRGSRA